MHHWCALVRHIEPSFLPNFCWNVVFCGAPDNYQPPPSLRTSQHHGTLGIQLSTSLWLQESYIFQDMIAIPFSEIEVFSWWLATARLQSLFLKKNYVFEGLVPFLFNILHNSRCWRLQSAWLEGFLDSVTANAGSRSSMVRPPYNNTSSKSLLFMASASLI